MPQVLKGPKLPQQNRASDMNGRIDPQFHSELPTGSQSLIQMVHLNDLGYGARQNFVDIHSSKYIIFLRLRPKMTTRLVPPIQKLRRTKTPETWAEPPKPSRR